MDRGAPSEMGLRVDLTLRTRASPFPPGGSRVRHDAAMADRTEELAEAVGDLAQERGWTVGTAESLTSGAVASALGAAPESSEWFAGGIVAYSREVKHSLLEVPQGPVVCREAACAMSEGAARLLHADLVVALTGAGGPDPQDGRPPGTVWLCVHGPDGTHAEEQHFDGDPPKVVRAATVHALERLRSALDAGGVSGL